jgi:putative phosphotransacetylase
MFEVSIGVSARHIHLAPEHIHMLFGEGYTLKELKPLSQPGQFAAEETVAVVGPKGRFEKVRILGPARGSTQLEISRTDAFTLGMDAPVRLSGSIEGTPGLRIVGPQGEVTIDKGVIVAGRHIHLHTEDAARMNIQDKQIVSVKTEGERGVIFTNVVCRVSDTFALDMHIDTDEANGAGVRNGDKGTILI